MLAGRARNEDAAVVAVPAGKALVQTVDILAPLLDDPYLFGRIAAANALSDVYALGGEPWCAMNIACFPQQMLDEEPQALADILRGGMDALTEAGAVLVGGHTVADDAIKYGLSVTGLIEPGSIATNDGLRAGDVLLLTKPIGSGVLSTAVKAHWGAWERAEEQLGFWCGRLNKGGAAVIRALGLRAATDVTGFGLGGHVLEMAQASGVCVELTCAAVPLFEGAEAYAADGLIPAASHGNSAFCACRTRVERELSPALHSLMFDVQTSGGLVLAVPPAQVDAARQMLLAGGDMAAIIGTVRPAREDGAALLLR